jgi:hypothetical protein
VEKIKTWEDVISYMQDNPDSILVLDSVGNSTPRLLLNGELIIPRMPWELDDKRLQASPHKIFGITEYKLRQLRTANDKRNHPSVEPC